MPGENLTRLEAQERAAFLAVESYAVALDLTTGPETFRSTTTVRFTADGGTTTFIDAITAEVHSVTLNGATARREGRERRAADPARRSAAAERAHGRRRLRVHEHR